LLLSKPYIHKDGVNISPFLMMTNQMTILTIQDTQKSVGANHLNHTRATAARKIF